MAIASYSATGLPAGLTLNASTGVISGTPTAAGTTSVTVTATDDDGATCQQTFNWTTTPPPNQVPVCTNPGDQTSEVGTAITPLQFVATDAD